MALELPRGPKITYALQRRRCGKSRCRACRDGPGHGPYWYAFWEEDGRSRSRYLGKEVPPAAAQEIGAQGTPTGPADAHQAAPYADANPPVVRSAQRPAHAYPGTLRVRTLGGFAVWNGEEPIPPAAWHKRKAATLLKVLVCVEGQQLRRDQALDLLWPDRAPAAAASNFSYTVHLLRRILDGPGAGHSHLRLKDDVLRLLPSNEGPPDDSWLDAATFTRQANVALSGQNRDSCRAALALYGGEYLPDDRYADWASARREELHGLYLALLLHLAALSGKLGHSLEAIDSLRAILATDPYHEAAARLLMEALAAEDRHHESEHVYLALRVALREALGVAPARETVQLHRRLQAHPGNLPTPLTSFIGRQEQVASLQQLLHSTRLLTLTGAGGSGKTRLALAVATALRRTYLHGAWLVELASLGDPSLVPQQVAVALGVREQAGQALMESLASFLSEQDLLLVLDNCEHLLEPCAALAATLLGACQGLRILATSREALAVAGETIWRVPSLSLPMPVQPSPGSLRPGNAQRSSGQRPSDGARLQAPQDEAVVALLEQAEAARLFVARARACCQDFVLRADTAAAVARICWQLDGLPLAIELAAAMVSLLPVEGIAARLDDRLGLLTNGPRTVLPRHQTLRAVMDWGHNLLTERERVLFRRLAVFAGGWTLGAAELVCAGDGIEKRDVLQLLGALVNKSLVVLEDQNGDGHYRLLETVRQYAQEQLGLAAESTAVRNRHLEWYVRLGEQAEPALRGPGQAVWLARLETELDNLRAALTWAGQEESQLANGERLAGLLWRFWTTRGYLSEGRRLLSAFLASTVAVPATLRAGTLAAAGRLAYYQSDYAQATKHYEASLELYRAVCDEQGIATAYNGLGLVLADQGEYDRAARFFEQSLALSRKLQDTWAAAGARNNLGMVAHRQGDYQRSAAWLEESLAGYRQLGDTQGMANTLNTWGVVAMDADDPNQATTLLEESLALHRELNGAQGMAIALSNLGMLARQEGDYARAGDLLREGLVIFQNLDAEAEISLCLEALALIAGTEGQHEQAARLFGAADAQRQALGTPLPAAECAIHDASVDTMRESLGEEAFLRCWAAGRAMSRARAVAVAAEATKRPVSAPSTATAAKH